MAKKLFVRASSSDSWCAICADDFKAKSCVLRLFHAIDTYQTVCVCDSWHSPTSASLLSLFRGNDVKAFQTAAI